MYFIETDSHLLNSCPSRLQTRQSCMHHRTSRYLNATLIVGAFMVMTAPTMASPQSVDAFYKGKTVTAVVGSDVGGGYDAFTRLLTRHIARHIPGEPRIIVQNMPGASGIKALNYTYTVAPRDGSMFAAAANTMPFDPLFGGPAARYDVFQLNWLGSMSKQTNVCLAWHTTPFKTIDDAMTQKMRVSATGATGWRAFLPNLFNGVAGTKFDVINGYDSTGSMLAIERGEVDGVCADYATIRSNNSDWIEQKKIVVLAQFGLTPLHGLEGVPMGLEKVSDDADRKAVQLFMMQQEWGRPFVMPPAVPADRLQAMRTAFDATMKDQQFLTEAEKMRIEVNPLSGSDLDRMFKDAYGTPSEIIERTKVLLKRAGAI